MLLQNHAKTFIMRGLVHARNICSGLISLDTQTKKTDQYFLDSASEVSFFFEEDAFAEDGSLRQAKALSINKIGHGERLLLSFRLQTWQYSKMHFLAVLALCRNALYKVASCRWFKFCSGCGIAALHDLDPDFRSFSRSEKVAAILRSLDIKLPLPVQSMYIFKVGSAVHVSLPAHSCDTSASIGDGIVVLLGR